MRLASYKIPKSKLQKTPPFFQKSKLIIWCRKRNILYFLYTIWDFHIIYFFSYCFCNFYTFSHNLYNKGREKLVEKKIRVILWVMKTPNSPPTRSFIPQISDAFTSYVHRSVLKNNRTFLHQSQLHFKGLTLC